MGLKSILAFLLLAIFLLSCKKKNDNYFTEYEFDFNEGMHGWNALFSDYPAGEENFYELSFERTGLPAPLNHLIKSLKVSGNNHSDDLLSIIFKKIDGLAANTSYQVSFNVDVASKACISCAGVGGSPNLSLGAGGLKYEPANTTDATNPTGYYRPNFITEIQGHRSNNIMKVLGKTGIGEEADNPYGLLNLNNTNDPVYLSTNANGELWLIIGTDSGFEATTTLYYKQVTVILKK